MGRGGGGGGVGVVAAAAAVAAVPPPPPPLSGHTVARPAVTCHRSSATIPAAPNVAGGANTIAEIAALAADTTATTTAITQLIAHEGAVSACKYTPSKQAG